jgi:hypothetical protein
LLVADLFGEKSAVDWWLIRRATHWRRGPNHFRLGALPRSHLSKSSCCLPFFAIGSGFDNILTWRQIQFPFGRKSSATGYGRRRGRGRRMTGRDTGRYRTEYRAMAGAGEASTLCLKMQPGGGRSVMKTSGWITVQCQEWPVSKHCLKCSVKSLLLTGQEHGSKPVVSTFGLDSGRWFPRTASSGVPKWNRILRQAVRVMLPWEHHIRTYNILILEHIKNICICTWAPGVLVQDVNRY